MLTNKGQGAYLGFPNPYYIGSNEQLEDTNIEMCNQLSSGISSFGGYIPTILIILGVIMVMGAIAILILVIKNVEKNGLTGFSMEDVPTEYVIGTVLALGVFVFIAFAVMFASGLICSIQF